MGRCATCLESTLLDRLQITPEDLRRSWVEAQRGQAFGDIVDVFDRAKFFEPMFWPRLVGDVREGLSAARGAYNGAAKLAPRIYDAVVALGERSDEAAVTAALGPVFRDLVLETQKDTELQLLRGRPPVLERIFGDGEAFAGMMATAKERIVKSIEERPPPAETPHSLEQIEVSALSAAQRAFQRVMTPAAAPAAFGAMGYYDPSAPTTGDGAIGAMRRTGGAVVAAMVWLRDSIMRVLIGMLKFVRRSGLLLVLLCAVIFAFCALLGREFKDGEWATRKVGMRLPDGVMGPHALNAHDRVNLSDYANIDLRTYDFGLCGYMWQGIDILTKQLDPEAAAGLDALFSRAIGDMSRVDLETMRANFMANPEKFKEQMGGLGKLDFLVRLTADLTEDGQDTKKTIKDVLDNQASDNAAGEKNKSTGSWIWANMSKGARVVGDIFTGQQSRSISASVNASFPKEIAAARKLVELLDVTEKKGTTTAEQATLVESFVNINKEALAGYVRRAGGTEYAGLDGGKVDGDYLRKFMAESYKLDGAKAGKAGDPTQRDMLLGVSAHIQRQHMGLASFLSKTGGVPGLDVVGDFLGINNVGTQQRTRAIVILTMLVTIGYFFSPAFMLGVLLAVAAGAAAHTQGQLSPTESIGIAVTVLFAVMKMIPMSDDQSEYIKAVSGMVLDTSKQIQGIQMQRLAAENAITAQRNAMLAQVGGGLAGAAGGFFAGPAGAATAYNLASTVAGSALNASLEHQKLLQQRRGYFGARRGPYGASRFV
jgi:hypothetical protein